MKKFIKAYWPLFFGMTMCIAVLYILNNKNMILNPKIISNMTDHVLQDENIRKDYLFYLLKLRGSQIFFLLCMKLMKKERLGLFVWLWLTGIGIGVGAFSFIMLYQIQGFIFLFVLLCPHYFLYLTAYYKYKYIDLNGQTESGNLRKKGVYIVKKLVLALVVIIGLLTEYYVNPFFLKILKKIIYLKNYNI